MRGGRLVLRTLHHSSFAPRPANQHTNLLHPPDRDRQSSLPTNQSSHLSTSFWISTQHACRTQVLHRRSRHFHHRLLHIHCVRRPV
ncbi:hypothetical protein PMIN01_07217 [Paraphaeosphaeria minitans]|uniref:Uncharacterized protein n=1 Tax=Paraphaeosphaeria minitans TaxID=565426 RepID=A0A9P6GHK9_9PLEO|nr:hypothetical protein PMIN01_07217 [Paraphaeosphaeria minitans]